MRKAIVSKKGELLQIISGNQESIELNTPDDCFATDDPPDSNMYYENGWVSMPPRPSLQHVFDYSMKQWVDPRSLDDIKTQKWESIKFERDACEFGGFEFEGNVYDSNLVSQARIRAAAGTDQIWTLADNTTTELTAIQMTGLHEQMQKHIAEAHERGRIARQLIYEAETKEQVEAIVF